MIILRFYLCLAALLAHGWHHHVLAQYQQDYIYNPSKDVYFYVPQEVIDVGPNRLVILAYNCYYMRDICKNAMIFLSTDRGMCLHPRSVLPNDIFAYDFNNKERTATRRTHSCPSSWKTKHTCPETDQQKPMRHDGEWWTKDLEPFTAINLLMNKPLSTDSNTGLSKIRYTCDEFPPASWVEGGDGEDKDQAANTRCAGQRCRAGTKSEQDWQATAHNRLRSQLQYVINSNKTTADKFSKSESVAFFRFMQYTSADSVAAKVYSFTKSTEGILDIDTTLDINQGFVKRDEMVDNSTVDIHSQGLWALNYEQIQGLISAGYGKEYIVSTNDSYVQPMSFPEDEEDFEDDDSDINKRGSTEDITTPLLKRATEQDLQDAQAIVDKAMAESARLNGARMARPLRNNYGRKASMSTNANVVPLLSITDEIAKAAALVAEANAWSTADGTTTKRADTGTYWMESLTRKGTVPWGDNSSYVVFRNVLEYGAVGDGVTDDTEAINNAMTSGSRCGEKCNGSTTKNAIVYFPPGNYLISSTVPMPFGTQVIGDAITRPILVASSSFIGLGVLSTDEYTGGDGGSEEYYTNTANFYRQIRNIVIDITQAGANISCLHYQVAQATSLQNVELIASSDSSLNQIGMYAENGSGGQIADVTFTGGNVGLYGGSQQFTAQRLVFNGCVVGVHVIWDWGWVWKSVTMTDVNVGFRLASDDNSGSLGSVSVLDSSFTNVATAALIISPPSEAVASNSTGVVLENVALSGVTATVVDTAGKVYLDGSSSTIGEWVLGPTYEGSTTTRSFSEGIKVGDHRRHADLLDDNGAYFERAKPQYENYTVDDFVHIKDLGVTGDGWTDDTSAFQAAVYATLGKILFVDAGSYILTSTIIIPSGTMIVGETWSQLVAYGSYFQNASDPQVLIKVGLVGSVGNVELQDLLFTTRGPTAGLVLIEWNMQASTAGSAGMWDCHARIGGATGTELTPTECPASTSGIDADCSAASLMMRLTSMASGYFENVWLWGADHMIDDPDLVDSSDNMTQCSIYIARGFLIESTHPTWLYATASEHSVFYQYNFYGAANIFAGMLQTESPYFQPTPPPPAPFADVVGNFPGDPDYTCTDGDAFNGCDESWAAIITGGQDIFIAGAGLYSWFSTYSEDCIDSQQCQNVLLRLDNNYANVRIQNLITIGAEYMAVMDGEGITAADNLNVAEHPDWSQVTILDVGSNGTTDFSELVWIDPTIWDMDEPSFTCVPPCLIQLPPYTATTSTVNYPLMTISSGTWTSTITKAPITISEWILDIVTITAADSNGVAKRDAQGFVAFTPTPATTPFWPSIAYMGLDGVSTTTAPTQTFPTPPAGLVKKEVTPIEGYFDYPFVEECFYLALQCINNPWMYGDATYADTGDDSDPGDDYENADELKTECPALIKLTSSSSTSTSTSTSTSSSSSSSSTSSSSSITTTSTSASAEPSPSETGDPSQNVVSCYNSGEKTENVRMESAISSFCGDISNDTFTENYYSKKDFPFTYNGGIGTVDIVVSLEIKPDCTWAYDEAECERYLKVPTDSCNCGGVNGKQGGTVTNNCLSWRIDPNVSL